MSKAAYHKFNPAYIVFFCPGCDHLHSVPIANDGKEHPVWEFNNDLEKPTIKPSINNLSGKYADPNWKEPDDTEGWSTICHSFVTDGMIQFLGDCTHHLKGQTVQLPELKD